mgnify:CR=1 FL=1
MTKKGVSFKPTITIVRFHDLSSVETRWLSIPERKQLIAEARVQAKDWANKGYGFLLNESFHTASDSTQEKVDAYCQLPGGDYCRGLERHVCREHGLRRDALKKGAVRVIVAEGKKLRERGLSNEAVEKQLADIAGRLSLCATRFAMRLGAADELAALVGEDGSKINRILVERSFNQVDKLGQSQHSNVGETSLVALGAQHEQTIYLHHRAA